MTIKIPDSIAEHFPSFDEERYDYVLNSTDFRNQPGVEMFDFMLGDWKMAQGNALGHIYRKPKERFEWVSLKDQKPGDEWTTTDNYPNGWKVLLEGQILTKETTIIRRRLKP